MISFRRKLLINKLLAPFARVLLDIFRYTFFKRFILALANKLHRGISAKGIKNIRYLGYKWRLDIGNFLERDIYLEKWELPETKLCAQIIEKNMVVFDIGANIGYYTLLFSKLAGETGIVYAFEPIKKYYEHMLFHLKINKVQNVRPEKLILSSTEGKLTIFPGESSARIDLPQGDQSAWKKHLQETVETTTLDRYVQKNEIAKLNFIKIDVDGHEVAVLKGAEESIKKFYPVILLEFCEEHQQGAGKSGKELLDLIISFGYDLYDVQNHEKIIDLQAFEKKILDIYPDSIDVLCRPK